MHFSAPVTCIVFVLVLAFVLKLTTKRIVNYRPPYHRMLLPALIITVMLFMVTTNIMPVATFSKMRGVQYAGMVVLTVMCNIISGGIVSRLILCHEKGVDIGPKAFVIGGVSVVIVMALFMILVFLARVATSTVQLVPS